MTVKKMEKSQKVQEELLADFFSTSWETNQKSAADLSGPALREEIVNIYDFQD